MPIPLKFKIPKGANLTGKYIIVVLDDVKQIPESDETNNTAFFGTLP